MERMSLEGQAITVCKKSLNYCYFLKTKCSCFGFKLSVAGFIRLIIIFTFVVSSVPVKPSYSLEPLTDAKMAISLFPVQSLII